MNEIYEKNYEKNYFYLRTEQQQKQKNKKIKGNSSLHFFKDCVLYKK